VLYLKDFEKEKTTLFFSRVQSGFYRKTIFIAPKSILWMSLNIFNIKKVPLQHHRFLEDFNVSPATLRDYFI